jgi:hypothetical protein
MPNFIENFMGGFSRVFLALAFWAASAAGAAAVAARNSLRFTIISSCH